MPGGEETPTPEDSSLSVASLIAELDILQYRDAFASAGIDDERLRAIYKSGVDAVEEMIVATQLYVVVRPPRCAGGWFRSKSVDNPAPVMTCHHPLVRMPKAASHGQQSV